MPLNPFGCNITDFAFYTIHFIVSKLSSLIGGCNLLGYAAKRKV